MATDREILTKYMEIIDSLNFALAQAKSIDGVLAQNIEPAIANAKSGASKVSYRIQREKWDAAGGTYES